MLAIFRDLFAPPRHMILLVIAAWIGLALAEKRAERHGITKDDLNNIAFYALLAFIIGGRISFVLQNIPAFLKSPLSLISINPDIFDPFGAIAGAVIVLYIYGQRRNLKLWSTLDALTPFFALLGIGLGLSHFAAGTSFGKETELPWGIELWNATRHPTQLYETLASLLTFGLLWLKKQSPRPGMLFLLFAALTALSQLVIEAFRADNPVIANGIQQNQILAWFVLALSFLLMELRIRQSKKRD
ncbi:MAG: prolipoprotein diacylglyceryl transferase [Anaerolineales bacterium]|nr:prolipoprotein diacylglyceryl transferase [Anaerolineales bacterium]